MNVIVCGYHWTGCKAIELLRAERANLFVFTHRAPYHIPSVSQYCRQVGIRHSLEDVSKAELPFVPDVICSVYYRNVIKKHVIDSCKGRIFNLHPSVLPRYRGCSSLTWAIIEGEEEVGFTYHYIDEGCDTGDIILQRALKVERWDTQETLFMRVMFEAMKDFPTAFKRVREGQAGVAQKGESSYFKRGCPHGGLIDPSWEREYKERFIRAMIFPPYPVARLGDREVYSMEDLEGAPAGHA